MKIIFTKVILIASLALSVISCRKDSPIVMNPEDVSYFTGTESYPSEIFKNFWNAMNTSYVFWDIDPTDWDAIYTQYAPKFEELDLIFAQEDSDDLVEIDNYEDDGETTIMARPSYIQSFEYIKQMTANIIDGHYDVELKGVGYEIPSLEQMKSRDYYHDESTRSEESALIWNAFCNKPSEITNIKIAKYDNYLTIYSGEIDGIAHLRINYFLLYEAIEGNANINSDSSNATVEEILENFVNITKSEDFKGAIIDLRNNAGGYDTDLRILFGNYVNQNDYIPIAQTRQKNGPGRLDYSPYMTTGLIGSSSEPTVTFPVVTLINLYSISMAEMFCLFAKEFNPNSVIIGERSYGANGPIVSNSILSAGVVENDYMLIYTAGQMTVDNNGVCYEGVGITPDIEILYNDAIDDLKVGTDVVMNRAIEYLNNL